MQFWRRLQNAGYIGSLPKDRELYYQGELWVAEVDAERMEFSVGGGGPGGWYLFFGALAFTPGLVFTLAAILIWIEAISNNREYTWSLWFWAIFGPGLALTGALLNYLQKRAANPPAAFLSRADGQLILPRKARAPLRFDFNDIDGYIADVIAPSGARHHELHLYAVDPKTRERRRLFPLAIAPTYSGDDVMALWSFLCQYMDKSRPLPNRPELWPAMLASLTPQPRSRKEQKAAEDAIMVDYCRRMREAGSKSSDLGVPPEYDPASAYFAFPHLLKINGA